MAGKQRTACEFPLAGDENQRATCSESKGDRDCLSASEGRIGTVSDPELHRRTHEFLMGALPGE